METVFEKQEWAEDRVTEIKQTYGLIDDDIRLVKHVSTPETEEKPKWEVYVNWKAQRQGRTGIRSVNVFRNKDGNMEKERIYEIKNCPFCGELLDRIWFTALMTEEWSWNGWSWECTAR